MRDAHLVITSQRVITPTGIRPASVHISDGIIIAVDSPNQADHIEPSADVIDVGSLVVMPGVVDSHVHVNDPGRTDWEGFESAGRAAAAGGVTTMIDMPLNSTPVTTSVAALEAKVAAAQGSCTIDFGLWAGVLPGNSGDLEALLGAGALGAKCFISPSGIDDFPHVDEAELRLAMPILARRGATLLVHAELPRLLNAAAADADPSSHATYLETRPPEAETEAISLMIRLAKESGCAVHIVHVSAAESLPLIASARAAGVPITAETCPHYLSFSAEDVPDGATHFKCAPPIRAERHREALWAALADGTLDLVASDHSPCPPDLKHLESGDFLNAWGGISSLQLALRMTWTEAHRRGHDLLDVTRWMCEGPARLGGLAARKGRIAVGHDADLVVFDPDAADIVREDELHHRHPLTPYDGMELRGRVAWTYVRGTLVYDGESFTGACPGRWLQRDEYD